jgi:hypothetical protein
MAVALLQDCCSRTCSHEPNNGLGDNFLEINKFEFALHYLCLFLSLCSFAVHNIKFSAALIETRVQHAVRKEERRI